jgi:nitroreductase
MNEPENSLAAGLGEPIVTGLMQAIAHRRSMGAARLSDAAVDPAIIERILTAANWAPSHGETEPWRFTVFTDAGRAALGEAFANAYREMATADGSFKESTFGSQRTRGFDAPVWISLGLIPGRREDGSFRMSIEDERLAVGCAVQNLHLMANAIGLGGMLLSKGVMVHDSVRAFLGLTEPGAELLGFFILGWPNIPWPTGERDALEAKVTWIS